MTDRYRKDESSTPILPITNNNKGYPLITITTENGITLLHSNSNSNNNSNSSSKYNLNNNQSNNNRNSNKYATISNQVENGNINNSSIASSSRSCSIISANNQQLIEIHSTKSGIIHQILLTTAIFILTAGCGMPIGYSAILLPQLYNTNDTLAMDIEMGSWFASVHSLATPVGSFVSGPIMDHFGRRPTLMFTVLPVIIGWSLLATASSHTILIIGRIIAGISVGLTAAPAQVLIAECAEPHLRGLLVGVPFVAYSLGILFVYALGALLHWRLVAWCGLILPLLALLAIFLVPESPTWLARKNRLEKASNALQWFRGNEMMAKRELNELIQRIDNERKSDLAAGGRESLLRACSHAFVLKPLLIINGFHFFLTLSGTYLIVFYAVDIISELGGTMNTMTAAVITAVIRLAFTIVCCFMLLYVRRRTMIIQSGIGSAISSLTLGIFMYWRSTAIEKTSWDLAISAICIFIYIGSNTAFLVMPGIMVGELLPAIVRGRIAGFIFTILNLAVFCIAKFFPIMKQTLKTHGLFMVFGLASFGATALMYFMLPETRGKTLGEIEDYFRQDNLLWRSRIKSSEFKNNNINNKDKDNKDNDDEDEDNNNNYKQKINNSFG